MNNRNGFKNDCFSLQKAETSKEEIVSHWHPNITINIVHDFTQWTRGMVPAPLDEYLEFTPAGDR